MRINTKFPVAVHILALASMVQEKGMTVPSEVIADSVGTNPVVIRQMLAVLRRAGLVETKSGVPGCTVTKSPQDISLLDIYRAVQTDEMLFDFHTKPKPDCFVGGHIIDAMTGPLQEAQAAMEQTLAGYSLADITAYIREKTHW